MPDYLLYTPSVETIEPDEVETQEKIIQLMRDGMSNVHAKDGRWERISHAKAYGLLKGTLTVPSGLAPELAQGANGPRARAQFATCVLLESRRL